MRLVSERKLLGETVTTKNVGNDPSI